MTVKQNKHVTQQERNLDFSMESGWGFMLQHVLGIMTTTNQATPKKMASKMNKIVDKYIERVDDLPDLEIEFKDRLLRELEDLKSDISKLHESEDSDCYRYICVHLFMLINLLLGYTHQTGKAYHTPYFVKSLGQLIGESEETEGKSGDRYRFFSEKSSKTLGYRKEMIGILKDHKLSDAEIGVILKLPTNKVSELYNSSVEVPKNE